MAQADFTRIATNIGALNALQSLRTINNKLGIHQQRLSTGKRINSAADDPAGLTIATKMFARAEGLKVALDNIGDAKNLLSVAEAGLSKLTDILVNMRSNAERAASDTLGVTERDAIASQLESFAQQIDNIVAETKWNGVQLLNGNVSKQFQTGVDEFEHTIWQLTQEHTGEELGVSMKYTSADVSASTVVDAGVLTGVSKADSGPFSGLTALSTGTYTAEALDAATSATVGKVNVDGIPPVSFGDMTASTPGVGAELAESGTYTLKIIATTGDNTDVDYDLTIDGVTEHYTGIDLDASAGVLLDAALGDSLGITLSGMGFVAADDEATFEYIKADQFKLGLKNGSGGTVQISSDGIGAPAADFAYVDSDAGTFDTGRGVKVATADVVAAEGDEVSFHYHRAGNNVVDVSSATTAASYMTDVTNALDIVNASMSDLGALMARLTYKEEAVSVAQINVEASYNRIMNADMAYEQLESTKMSILQQTAITMLAQANMAPQGILALFR